MDDLERHSVGFVVAIVCVCLFLGSRLLSYTLNMISDSYAHKINSPLPKIYFDMTHITIKSICLTGAFLDAINASLHYNCQIEEFSVQEIRIRLFPYIHVVVDGIIFKGYSLPPSKWSMDGVIAALQADRLDSLDEITRRLYKVLYRSFKLTKTVEHAMKWVILKVLHLLDIGISTAYCDITNIQASFCATRTFTPKDVTVQVHIGHIEVKPSSSMRVAFYTPMFTMSMRVENVSITSRLVSTGDLAAPPMLAPLTVEGSITLPKILSQMTRKAALPSKYCHLNLKATHVIVDLGKVNIEGLMNFSLAIIYYRMWYTGVMAFYEKTLEVATSPDIDPQTALTNYVALYSNYAQCAGHKIHMDRSKSFFSFARKDTRDEDLVFVLRQKCRKFEEHMSSDVVIHARVLALGWKEQKDTFQRTMHVGWSGDSDKEFLTAMKTLFEQESLAHKELRHIKVSVTADQVDFLLSTPRTTEAELHMGMTNYPIRLIPPPTSSSTPDSALPGRRYVRRFTKQDPVPPPVMLSVCGIDLLVVDPIVPASHAFDKVRDVFVEVKRMRFSSPDSSHEQVPTTELTNLSQTVLDVFGISDGTSNDSNSEAPLSDYDQSDLDDFDNANSCADLTSIPKLKTEKTIFATEKVHTRVLNADSIHVGQHKRSDFNISPSSVPMVSLTLHEDPECEILSLEATLSNTIVLIDVSNILGIAEYSLAIVQDVTVCTQRWGTNVDILQASDQRPALPTALLQGKQLNIIARANNLAFGCREPNVNGDEGRSKIFLYRFNATICLCSNSYSESISGCLESPIFATYELIRGLTTASGPNCSIQTYVIMLRPSNLICNVMDDFRGEFKYVLYRDTTAAPTIFTDDEVRGVKANIKHASGSFRMTRKTESTMDVKMSNILFRHLHWRSDPFVVNISEQELNILIHWLEHSLTAAQEGALELDLDLSRMKSTADAVNSNASIEEFMHQMEKIFKTHNISGDDEIQAYELRKLFLSDFVSDSLLDSELAEHENDLMFLFDPHLKGHTTPNAILSHCREIRNQSSWDPRGNVKMFFKDFFGIRPSALFSDALHDGSALSRFWSLIEQETKIRRASGTLAGIPSAAVQMLLVRLCGDGALARSLWERIIRNNLKDKHEHLHPWVIDDDREILTVPTAGEVIRHKINGSDFEDFIQFAEKSKKQSLLTREMISDSKDYLDEIDMSVTCFDIMAGTVQWNYLDSLLGPLLPRFQFSLSKSYVDGTFSHLGIVPDLSFTSNYSLVSRIFGGLTLEACFFNSAVSSHEPIIEPFSIEFGAVNVPSDATEFSIHVKDTDKLKLVVSAALLETLSSAIFCIIDISSKYGGDHVDEAKDATSAAVAASVEAGLPSFIIINRCGLDLNVQTYVTDLEEERIETSDPLNSVSAPNGKVTPVRIPWSLMYRSYSDNCFPEVLLSSKGSKECMSASHHYTTGSPVSVHSLSVAGIFLTKENIKKKFAPHFSKLLRRMKSEGVGRSFSTLSSDGANVFNPGVVLESKNNHEYDCGTVFLARSNVRIKNMTGSALSLRADCPKNCYDENQFAINNFEVKCLPLPLIDQEGLSFSLQNGDGTWTKSFALLDLISCDSARMMVGGFLVYIESTRHYHDKDKVEMHDYLIEIVSGIRLVNALPYRIEVRYSQEKYSEHTWMKMSSSTNKAKSIRVKVESGNEALIPVNLEHVDHLKVSFRLDSFSPDTYTPEASKLNKFSDNINLSDFFDMDMPNISSEDVTVHHPNADGINFHKRHIRVRKVRDASKESVHSMFASTPTIEFFSDLWVQNNSGIPLFFKFKDSKGKYLEVQDSECGSNQILSGDSLLECGGSRLTCGPVLGLLDSEKMQIKIDSERQMVANDVTLHKFTNLKTRIHLPSTVHSGIFKNSSWSKQVCLSSNSVITGEIECDGIWLGISIESGKGIFSNTTIAVITPRFLIQNNTALDIDFFPVRLWKRMRKSSTDLESQGMRMLAKSNEKQSQPVDVAMSEEELTLQGMLSQRSHFNDSDDDSNIEDGAADGIDDEGQKSPKRAGIVGSSSILSTRSNSACTFFSFCTSSRRTLSNFMNTEYSALAMRINETKNFRVESHCNSIVVGILSASNLMAADILGSSDPFCEVFWQGELIHTTACLINTLNPTWGESVRLHIKPEAMRMAELRIVVYDHDLGGQKEFLGQVTLRHRDLIRNPGKPFETCLMYLPNDKDRRLRQSQGMIRLMIDFNRDGSLNTWTAPVPIGIHASEAVSACTSDGERHLLEVNVEESNSFNIITISEYSATNLPAFMIVNCLQDLHLRFRQKHTNVKAYSRQVVRPMEYLYYAWDDTNLPKVIDLVAVDKHGNESPVESYVLENVGKKHAPLNVSMLDNHRTHLLVKVVIEGHTRKLIISSDIKESKLSTFGNHKMFQALDSSNEINVSHIRFMCSLSGLSLSLIDEVPRELIHFTIDDIEIFTLPNSNKIQLTVRHVQLDNMLSDADYQVVLSPFDSGYNSHLNEDFNYFTKESLPFLEVTLELDHSSLLQDTIIVEYFELKMQELNLFVDFNFVVMMASSMITPNVLDAVMRINRVLHNRLDLVAMRSHLNEALVQAVFVPKSCFEKHAQMLFFKTLILHSVGVRMTLSIALKKDLDIDPRHIGSQVEYSTIQNLMSFSRGITNINPHFMFGTISIANAFDTMQGIGWRLAKFYISSAGLQSLRILGSAEIIGDPAGGLLSLGSSIRMFAIKTKSELEGQAPVRAEGLKHLVQGVASISFGTVSKVANSVGEQLASVTGSDFKTDMAAKNPSHVGKGALQGGSIFYKTCKDGVTNVYRKPMEGYRKRSISKTARGVVTGISGLALAPIVGALGATAKLTKGIEATAHVFDDKPVGRIRPARSLFYSPQILPLDKSVFLVHFSLVLRGADFSYVSSDKRAPFSNLMTYFEDDDEPPSPRLVPSRKPSSDMSVHSIHTTLPSGLRILKRSAIAAYVIVVRMKYGSEERVSREIPLASIIRMSEKDLTKFDFKVKSKKGKFENRMFRISICLKHKNVFGMEVTIAKGLMHPLDLVTFLRPETDCPAPHPLLTMNGSQLQTIDENADDIVWQYKENDSRHRFERSDNALPSTSVNDISPHCSLSRKNRASHDTSSVISDLPSTSGVSVLSRGMGNCKMSQYVQSIIDTPKDNMTAAEKQFVDELNTYVTYPVASISSKFRKSFYDSDADSHTSTKDIFYVDCHTKVAAKKRNMKEIFFLRDFLVTAASASSGVDMEAAHVSSSESASSITMTTQSQLGGSVDDHHSETRSTPPGLAPMTGGLTDQEELYQVAEALKFRLYLSGSFGSAPAVHL